MKNLFNYYCEMCRDRGTIHRGFFWWKVVCPVCKGDPIGKFREDHPTPHMPPPNSVLYTTKTQRTGPVDLPPPPKRKS